MARAYDIADRLINSNKKSTVKLDSEHEYTINTSKNSAILMQAIVKDESLDEFQRTDQLIEAGIGKEALDYINSKDFSMEATSLVINVIMAAISDVTLEEQEKEAAKQAKEFRKRK